MQVHICDTMYVWQICHICDTMYVWHYVYAHLRTDWEQVKTALYTYDFTCCTIYIWHRLYIYDICDTLDAVCVCHMWHYTYSVWHMWHVAYVTCVCHMWHYTYALYICTRHMCDTIQYLFTCSQSACRCTYVKLDVAHISCGSLVSRSTLHHI